RAEPRLPFSITIADSQERCDCRARQALGSRRAVWSIAAISKIAARRRRVEFLQAHVETQSTAAVSTLQGRGLSTSYINRSRVVSAIGCCITSSSFFTILSPQTQSSNRAASLPNRGAALA